MNKVCVGAMRRAGGAVWRGVLAIHSFPQTCCLVRDFLSLLKRNLAFSVLERKTNHKRRTDHKHGADHKRMTDHKRMVEYNREQVYACACCLVQPTCGCFSLQPETPSQPIYQMSFWVFSRPMPETHDKTVPRPAGVNLVRE